MMKYQVKFCQEISKLRDFIEEVNRKGYEIVTVTEGVHGYTSYYTVIYRGE